MAGVHPAQEGGVKVPVFTLQSVCEKYAIVPDLIKLDIESFEHEVLLSSTEFLRRTKPRIHLELHLGMIRDRGLDARAGMRTLFDLGYRERSLGTGWADWEGNINMVLQRNYPINHYFLVPDSRR
jgi:hypothetical protein